MRWVILVLTPVLLGACTGPIGPAPAPIGPTRLTAAPSQEVRPPTVAPIDIVQPAATPPIEIARFRADLPDLGPAPELNNEVWLNTDQPVWRANSAPVPG
jgi:hypothetical protein